MKNSLGQKVYYAVEDTDCLTRNCCGPLRPFDMKILDNFKNEVIHLHRPLACDSCCFPCCLQVRKKKYETPLKFHQTNINNFLYYFEVTKFKNLKIEYFNDELINLSVRV